VLDCANGAAYSVAPTILRELGAKVIALHTTPDGLNINDGCGALHPEVIGAAVREHHADVGIALDGDADRVIMVDERGDEVDGDRLLAIAALELVAEGRLAHKTVVATQYANMGFEEALRRHGIAVVRVENGDRYVIEEMRRRGANLGGEQTGHLVFFDHSTTGDGTIAALQILNVMQERHEPLSRLAACMERWPQVTLGLGVAEQRPFERLPKVQAAIAAAERALKGEGRIFLRYSGTEQKVRIMVEAKDAELPRQLVKELAAAFREEGL
jgi:phosphoglucosamine mutase